MLPCPNTSRQTHNLVVTQPARRCRFASTLSCSPHTRAGLHSQVVCSPHACAGLHSCTHVVVQPTHTRGFAQPCRVQSARMRGFAPTLSTYLAAHKQARCDYVVNLAHSPGSGHTQAQSCICALCPYGCSPGALDLPCCVTDSRAAEGGDSDASGAGGPTKTLFASLDISISCDKDKDLDGQRHAMPLAMHVEKDLLDRFLEVCVCHTLLDC